MHMPRALLLSGLVALVVVVSGCTGLPDIFGGGGVSYANDIVVIRELTAVPSTIGKGQTVKVLAYVENVGDKSIGDARTGSSIPGSIEVTLYDYCEGLFTLEASRCGGAPGTGASCSLEKVLPKETRLVEWTLKPADTTKLDTTCKLKVAAKYPYRTDGVTTISFIDEAELQRLLQQGQFKSVASYKAAGYGPIKASFDVRGQQPIPAVGGWTPVLLEIENRGSGFLSAYPGYTCEDSTAACIPKEKVTIELDPGIATNAEACRWVDGHAASDVKLIKDKAPAILCEIQLEEPGKVEKDVTKRLQVTVDYSYEFRKEVPVTVKVVD